MTDQPFDGERTIIRPLPSSALGQQEAQPPPLALEQLSSTAKNPLLRAASTLLLLVTQINGTLKAPDIHMLHQKLLEAIHRFEREAEEAGVRAETVRQASYVLCTVLDEAILNTPWGHTSGWAQHNLLSIFHKEVYGGKRFFEMLRHLSRYPEKHLDMLELMYICLSLGFEGSYRIERGGHEQVRRIREELYQLIDRFHGGSDRALSLHWRGVEAPDTLTSHWPLWSIAAVMAAVLGTIYVALLLGLNRLSDLPLRELFAIHPPTYTLGPPVPPIPEAPPMPQAQLTLSELLAPEIEQGLVKVVETDRQAWVTLAGGALFPSGSAKVMPQAIPVLERVGQALEQVEGRIVVIGHTDNRPIHTVQFPSNWHLSKARAQSVAALIRRFLSDPSRITVEGRGDTEPIASNDTPEGRAKNRRVEILLIR